MSDCGKYTILLSLPEVPLREFGIRLKEIFKVVTHHEFNSDPGKYGEQILGVIFFPNPRMDITREFLAKMPNLKVFSIFCVAHNFLDLELFRERAIRVFNIGGIQSDDIADLVLGMMVALARKMVKENNGYKAGGDQYYRENSWSIRGNQVTGSSLGIVGMGSIGYQVALRAKAFRMKILYHNRKRRSTADEASVGAVYVPKLHDMLSRVDFLVICCPLTPTTRGSFSSKEFDLMKTTAVLINVARGAIVNTEALVTALQEGSIAAAGLDVTDPEPLPKGHPLMDMPNVLLTPHMGSSTTITRKKFLEVSIDNILAGIEGRSTGTELNSHMYSML